eukprot:1159937-Pelagomonas_calceolata.AAC.3
MLFTASMLSVSGLTSCTCRRSGSSPGSHPPVGSNLAMCNSTVWQVRDEGHQLHLLGTGPKVVKHFGKCLVAAGQHLLGQYTWQASAREENLARAEPQRLRHHFKGFGSQARIPGAPRKSTRHELHLGPPCSEALSYMLVAYS